MDVGGKNMYCNYCGKVIPDDANVCSYCGKLVAGVVLRRKLMRPRQGRKIAGVCAGLADYFDLDVTLIRLVWLVAGILMLPFWVIGYIVAWIIVPEKPETVTILPAGSSVVQQQG
ncbi:MAG: PspC domain-containing protein [Terriglobales bacterium]|jgi:phage shock protein C